MGKLKSECVVELVDVLETCLYLNFNIKANNYYIV
jgi:hypothetical protein